MGSDLVPYLLATARGTLESEAPLAWDPRACIGVVGAAQGYPGVYEKGHVIQGLAEAAAVEDAVVFQAGTRGDRGQVLTNGGRVVCVTALGADVSTARETAYRAFDLVRWSGKAGRTDIGLPRGSGVARGEPLEPGPVAGFGV
jgi:phosphoribosylamine--glycine ligase